MAEDHRKASRLPMRHWDCHSLNMYQYSFRPWTCIDAFCPLPSSLPAIPQQHKLGRPRPRVRRSRRNRPRRRPPQYRRRPPPRPTTSITLVRHRPTVKSHASSASVSCPTPKRYANTSPRQVCTRRTSPIRISSRVVVNASRMQQLPPRLQQRQSPKRPSTVTARQNVAKCFTSRRNRPTWIALPFRKVLHPLQAHQSANLPRVPKHPVHHLNQVSRPVRTNQTKAMPC